MKTHSFLIVAMLLVVGLVGAQAADIPGSKDPPFLKRYGGSQIVKYETRPYDRYNLAQKNTTPGAPPFKWTEIEGQITRLTYREPAGHTVLELLRNYQQALTDAGFTQIFDLSHGISSLDQFAAPFQRQGKGVIDGDFLNWMSIKDAGYIAAKRSKDGQDITVAVFFAELNGPKDVTFDGNPVKVTFRPTELVVMVDVITAKAVENKMVEVKAADMAEALATKGVVDLYGIYFDIDKTEIKSESVHTLDEVANLLKIDRSLKLEISGHTDNTGRAEHNMKLSEGRAQAVVEALVKKYGITAARLRAKGCGDTKPVAPNDTEEGRAKNRRVELRKL